MSRTVPHQPSAVGDPPVDQAGHAPADRTADGDRRRAGTPTGRPDPTAVRPDTSTERPAPTPTRPGTSTERPEPVPTRPGTSTERPDPRDDGGTGGSVERPDLPADRAGADRESGRPGTGKAEPADPVVPARESGRADRAEGLPRDLMAGGQPRDVAGAIPRQVTRDSRPDAAAQAAGERSPGSGGSAGGADRPDADADATLWPDGTAAEFDRRWRDIQSSFVDDPRAAYTAARELLDSATEQYTEALRRRLAGIAEDAGDGADTERLRTALRAQRQLLARLTR